MTIAFSGNPIRCATGPLLGRNFTYRPAGSLDFSLDRWLRINNPKRRRITGLPIVPPSVQRLKPPPLPGPVGSHGRVAVMDFRDQLRYRFPAKVQCDLRSNLEID